jgi:hypothetical protein
MLTAQPHSSTVAVASLSIEVSRIEHHINYDIKPHPMLAFVDFAPSFVRMPDDSSFERDDVAAMMAGSNVKRAS